MEYQGVLRFVDLGSGQWVLETSEGRRHPLIGPVPRELLDHDVIVQGRKVDALGFGLSADRSIEVHRILRA